MLLLLLLLSRLTKDANMCVTGDCEAALTVLG